MKEQGWRERLHQRIHGQRIARWRSGELDNAGFERAQRGWAIKIALLVLGPLCLAAVVLDWLMGARPQSEQIEHSLFLLGFFALLTVIVAFRMSRFARRGARDFLMRQARERAERAGR